MAFNLGPKVSSGINNMYSGLVSLSLEFTREINNREDHLDLERLRFQPLQRCGTTCVFYSSSPCYLLLFFGVECHKMGWVRAG